MRLGVTRRDVLSAFDFGRDEGHRDDLGMGMGERRPRRRSVVTEDDDGPNMRIAHQGEIAGVTGLDQGTDHRQRHPREVHIVPRAFDDDFVVAFGGA